MPAMRKWAKWAGAAAVVVCSVIYLRQVYSLVAGSHIALAASMGSFPAAIGVYMLAYLAAAIAWHQLVAALGMRPRPWLSIGIFTTSQFAKYLPGNVGHHAGRVFLATRHGYAGYKVVATMALEMAVTLALMLALSLPALDAWLDKLAHSSRVAALAVVAAVAALTVAALVYLGKHRKGGAVAAVAQNLLHTGVPRSTTALLCLAALSLICVQILLSALALGFLDRSGLLLSAEHVPTTIAVFCAAWLLGFLVPGAPAGIGIRETVLTAGLAPMVGREGAVLVALLFRVLTLAADLLAFVAGAGVLWVLRRQRGPDGQSGADQSQQKQ
jgi:glycosyltransferase 2 family protein